MTTPLRQFARAGASLGVLQIGGMALTFLVGLLLARQLGPAGYGVYALAMALTTMAGMLTEFGLPTLIMREFAKARRNSEWNELRGLFGFAQKFVLLFSVFLIAGFILYYNGFASKADSQLVTTLAWSVFLIPLVALAKMRGVALLALGNTISGQAPNLLLRPGLFAVALALVWFYGETLVPSQAMFWHVLASLAATITLIFLFHFKVPKNFSRASPEYQRATWMKSSFPMGATEGLRLAQAQLSLVLLGLFATKVDVGLFRVADAAILICLVPSSLLNLLAGPYFARMDAEQDTQGMQSILTVVNLTVITTLAIATIAVFLFGQQFIVLAFGDQFADAILALKILVAGWFLLSLLGPVASLSNMIGREKEVSIAMGCAIVAQLILTPILIVNMGITGAAVGIISSQSVFLLYLYVGIVKHTSYKPTVFSVRGYRKGAALALTTMWRNKQKD